MTRNSKESKGVMLSILGASLAVAIMIVLVAVAFAPSAHAASASCSVVIPCAKPAPRHYYHYHKKKAAHHKVTHRRVKRVYLPVAAATVASPGCVEIHFPKMRQGDIGVKGFIAEAGNRNIANDTCTGFKAEGDSAFRTLPNELCPKALPVFCDFARQEAVIGEPVRLKFSFSVKRGTAYVLRLPAYMATDGTETVGVSLVRSLITLPPGSTKAYRETVRYGVTNNAMMGVPSSCYEGGVATLFYAQSDVPATVGCRLYLYVPRTDWRGP